MDRARRHRLFEVAVTPDWEGLRRCILREGEPTRVHHIELFLDQEIQDAVAERHGVWEDIDPADPFAPLRKEIALQSFLGYDYVRGNLEGMTFSYGVRTTEDTAGLARAGGRGFVDLHRGPIASWEDFEAYPWPVPAAASTAALEWYEEHLPEGMCVMAVGGFGHFAEGLSFLMGYETLCMALCEKRDLVEAIAKRITDFSVMYLRRVLQFDRVKLIWGSDDMGFRNGLLLGPDDTREFMLEGHKIMARMAHDAGRPYLLHSCGDLSSIMEDLIEEVRIDAKHSYEDTIQTPIQAKREYGDRMAILGGIDIDFLCRSTVDEVRCRVRETLEACQYGGGYCLGTGNSVANYIPLDNYLAMLDEGRRFLA